VGVYQSLVELVVLCCEPVRFGVLVEVGGTEVRRRLVGAWRSVLAKLLYLGDLFRVRFGERDQRHFMCGAGVHEMGITFLVDGQGRSGISSSM